jgi:serine/threonine-protein kinase
VDALAPGQIVANRYLLVELIGEGAMGAVFRAEDQTLKRQVAIKFLFVRGARDPQVMVDQFLREARIAASVQHRNVIQTVDFGTVEQFQPFMVMELLSGESLGDRLAREPRLTREQLLHIISLTLRGLSAVHDAGIVHRDLKPQNIFLQRDAEAVYPKILDFGISRSVEHGGERPSAIATQEGLIIGTPDYMSPEQARGEGDIDKRSDIYSVGVILYEGLTGHTPFEANSIGELIVKIMTVEPQRVSELCPDVPGAISDLVAQAMAKDREQRFADARALRRALLAVAESGAPAGRRAVSLAPPGPSASASEPPPVPAPPSKAAAGAPATTWGDFEGLNARAIADRSVPPPPPPAARGSAAPVSPPQQRMVAALGDALDAKPRASHAQGGARRSRASSGKVKAPAAAPVLDDALDPLYSGAEQAAPDIDYDRAGLSAKKPAPASAREPTGRAVAAPRTPARKPLNPPPRERVRSRGSWAAWFLPIVALLLLGYVLYRPSAGSLVQAVQAGAGSRPELGAVLSRGAADSDLRDVRMRQKSRRAQPGLAAPHMRDVVF